MKALVLHAPQQLAVGEWATPQCGANDVLLRPLAAGICAGDLQHYGGRNPYTKYPLVCGHEVCGEVVELGGGVKRFKRGDLVVIEPVVGCGHCHPCRHGKPNCCMNFCLIGLHRPGGYADLCLAPEQNVHAVPAGLDPVTASFAEPLTIGIQACRRGDVAAGEYCLILGAGPIGLAILEVAKLRGARVVITDINEERLNFARELGAELLERDGVGSLAFHACEYTSASFQHAIDSFRGYQVKNYPGCYPAQSRTALSVRYSFRTTTVGWL
jgi:threonine dehydrogenase-like Zn-dependent dehydrogenase